MSKPAPKYLKLTAENVTVTLTKPTEMNGIKVDTLTLRVFGAADGSQARLVAMLDNLGKGASGAAVQNLNIMAGLDEAAGLRL